MFSTFHASAADTMTERFGEGKAARQRRVAPRHESCAGRSAAARREEALRKARSARDSAARAVRERVDSGAIHSIPCAAELRARATEFAAEAAGAPPERAEAWLHERAGVAKYVRACIGVCSELTEALAASGLAEALAALCWSERSVDGPRVDEFTGITCALIEDAAARGALSDAQGAALAGRLAPRLEAEARAYAGGEGDRLAWLAGAAAALRERRGLAVLRPDERAALAAAVDAWPRAAEAGAFAAAAAVARLALAFESSAVMGEEEPDRAADALCRAATAAALGAMGAVLNAPSASFERVYTLVDASLRLASSADERSPLRPAGPLRAPALAAQLEALDAVAFSTRCPARLRLEALAMAERVADLLGETGSEASLPQLAASLGARVRAATQLAGSADDARAETMAAMQSAACLADALWRALSAAGRRAEYSTAAGAALSALRCVPSAPNWPRHEASRWGEARARLAERLAWLETPPGSAATVNDPINERAFYQISDG
jgi:hypothetical protein